MVTNTNQSLVQRYQPMMQSTHAPSSSWGLNEMPGLATQADPGPLSRGSDHSSKSQLAGAESEKGREIKPPEVTQPRKGRNTSLQARNKPGYVAQLVAQPTSAYRSTPTFT